MLRGEIFPDSIDDFIEDLKAKGFIQEEFEDGGGEMGEEGEDGEQGNGTMSITAKMERIIRQRALDQIFGKLKRSGAGNHKTGKSGQGDEHTGDMREYRYGDGLENISMTFLSKLSFVVLVNDRKLSSATGFNALTAVFFLL